jgi:8-hydroxy-5-deazaflavin:NADPH oxidoreductase
MRIGIIGAGNIGATLAHHLARAGHEVAISNSRGPETLSGLVEELGAGARAVTPDEAVRFGDALVVSVPFGRYAELPTDGSAGKIVIDTNNYYPQRDGRFPDLDDDRTTSSELLQQHFAAAHVVKAFNAIQWTHLRDYGCAPGDAERVGIPISGDDPDAKRVVAGLVDEIGFDAVDAGTLADGGRKHQPGAAVYAADLPTARLRAEVAG